MNDEDCIPNLALRTSYLALPACTMVIYLPHRHQPHRLIYCLARHFAYAQISVSLWLPCQDGPGYLTGFYICSMATGQYMQV
jgi:hypothetical protein